MRIEKVITPYISENCYVLLPDGSKQALVVDPGYGAKNEIQATLDKLNATVGAVLCTHGHSDHIWEAAAIAADAPVYIPEPDRYRFDLDQLHPAEKERLLSLLPPLEVPRNLYSMGDDFVTTSQEIIPGLNIKMLPAPGHTEGSAIFFFNSSHLTGTIGQQIISTYEGFAASKIATAQNLPPVENPAAFTPVALVGDVIFADSVGRTDLPGGNPQQMLHTLRTLQNVVDPNTVLLPGHGALTVFGIEKQNNPYFAQARYQG